MLTSWKAIAAFFDRDVRTVQRWEREEGLPVHRHLHRRQSSVFAYTAELETWWARRLETPSPDASTPTVLETVPAASPSTAEGSRPSWTHRALALAAAVALAVALGVWAVSVGGRRLEPPAPRDLLGLDHPRALSLGAIGDVDGDGLPDVSAFSEHDGAFLVFGQRDPARGAVTDLARVRIEMTDNTTLSIQASADYDGDGIDDFLLASLAREPESFRRTGSAYLLRGRHAWPATVRLPADADVTFAYHDAQDIRMDACTAERAVDLNHDGIADVVLGAADYSPFGRASAGGAFVFFGRTAWPSVVDVHGEADIVIAGSRTGEGLTGHCAAGDFNNDGRQDLALMATESTLWYMRQGTGRYYVLLGRDRWPRSLDTASDSGVRMDGHRPMTNAAPPVMADVNGDGLDDLVTIAMHTLTSPMGPADIAILFGRPDAAGLTVSKQHADVVLDGDDAVFRIGPRAPLVDLDDDGIDDLVLNVERTGATVALRGRASWPARARLSEIGLLELFRLQPSQHARGQRVADLDLDGAPDLLTSGAFDADLNAARGKIRGWPLHASVRIDVRPGKEPNILYRPGVLVVSVGASIFSGDDPIDPETARLAGVAPTRSVLVDEDGRRELQMYFETAQMRVTADTTRISLTARTRSGRLLRGTDAVVVVPGSNVSLTEGPGR